jgi:hypothetical protein
LAKKFLTKKPTFSGIRIKMKMKLYKFRPLANDIDFNRAQEILNTGRFYCSGFSELNDPMEGAFTIFPNDSELGRGIINAIYSDKNKYKICSFSASRAFKKPTMWGYYANGFRGIAIEIEVNKNDVRKIKYVDAITHVEDIHDITRTTKEVLTTKLNPWKHEAEYRFLTESEGGDSKHKIGTITAIYFGHPYERAVNRERIYENSTALSGFENWKKKLIESAGNIKCYSVKIIENKVEEDKALN